MPGRLNHEATSKWPHRFAVTLACATFPLIWVGGLVTTYDAGMAVPDWPTTYGYNLFLYPISTWWAGPWDLFIEHGHRLLGALIGVITIGLLAAVWKFESRTWIRWAVVAALALVILQGVLGGQRVVRNSRQIAQIHGIIGPIFFTLAVFLATATSTWWREAKPIKRAGDYLLSAWMIAALALLQLVLGSNLRHVDSSMSPGSFSAFVLFHVAVAPILLFFMLANSVSVYRQFRAQRTLVVSAGLLGLLGVMQVALGIGTWVMNYGWPSVAARFGIEANFVVQAESFSQAMVATAHVAVGALILACSFAWAFRVSRLAWIQDTEFAAAESTSHNFSAGGVG